MYCSYGVKLTEKNRQLLRVGDNVQRNENVTPAVSHLVVRGYDPRIKRIGFYTGIRQKKTSLGRQTRPARVLLVLEMHSSLVLVNAIKQRYHKTVTTSVAHLSFDWAADLVNETNLA